MTVDGVIVYYSVAPRVIDKKNSLQPVRLITQDGRSWIRAYRGIAREYNLAGQWVRVWGVVFSPTTKLPKMIQGPHIRVKRFAPLDDRVLPRITRGGVPPVDRVQTLGDLSGPRRRWVAAQGVLETVGPYGHAQKTYAILRLRDDTLLEIRGIKQKEADDHWRPLGGEDVTALLEIEVSSNVRILRTAGVCQGRVDRCGLVPGSPLGPRKDQKDGAGKLKFWPGLQNVFKGGKNENARF